MTDTKITIEFMDLEDLKNTQVDICRLMKNALKTTITDGISDGYQTMELLEQMCEKGFAAAAGEIYQLKQLRRTA
jgi:hypothetical protein